MEDWRSKDDKVSREVWKTVEAKARKTRIAKTKERRKEKKKETEKEEDNRNEENSRGMENLGWRRSKIGGESKKASIWIFPSVNICFWKESKQKNANKKTIRSYNRN